MAELLAALEVFLWDELVLVLGAQQPFQGRRHFGQFGAGGGGDVVRAGDAGGHLAEQRQRGGGGLSVGPIDRGEGAQDDAGGEAVGQRGNDRVGGRFGADRLLEQALA